jgi:hypothetical protein
VAAAPQIRGFHMKTEPAQSPEDLEFETRETIDVFPRPPAAIDSEPSRERAPVWPITPSDRTVRPRSERARHELRYT